MPSQREKIEAVLTNRFDYHIPDGDKVVRHATARGSCKQLAQVLIENVPESRELSVALTKLEEVMFWANAGIARNS